jgi:hypothetical protein
MVSGTRSACLKKRTQLLACVLRTWLHQPGGASAPVQQQHALLVSEASLRPPVCNISPPTSLPASPPARELARRQRLQQLEARSQPSAGTQPSFTALEMQRQLETLKQQLMFKEQEVGGRAWLGLGSVFDSTNVPATVKSARPNYSTV